MSIENPLYLSICEEESRRKASIYELIKLSNIVVEKVKNDPSPSICDLKRQSVDNLYFNIEQMHNLMNYLDLYHQEEMKELYALKTNKIILILNKSIEFINSHMGELCSMSMDQYLKLDSENPTYFYDSENDFGTGKPTFAATALLTILGILEEKPHFSNLKEVLGDIYDIETSPVIQTVKFPESFDSEQVFGLKDSFYYYEGLLYEEPYEGLAVPHEGYFYGGSRKDPEYWEKEYKAYDCSSSVAKWCGLPMWLNTRNMISAHRGGKDKTSQKILQKLKPKPDISEGDILVIGNHTGVVTGVDDCSFTLLSYNRNLPYMDGIGYKEYDYNPTDHYYSFEYIGEDNPEVILT